MKKACKTLLVPKAKGLDPLCQVSKLFSLPKARVAGFLLKFRYGLMAYWEKYCFLICQEFACCMLTCSTSFQGVLPVKVYRGAHVRHLSMTPNYGKRKNLNPKLWVSILMLFTCQPSQLNVCNRKLRKYYFKYLLMCNREFTF